MYISNNQCSLNDWGKIKMASVDFMKALETAQKAIPVLGGIVISLTVVALVVGVILEIATDGSISMYSGIETFLNGTWVTDVVAFFTSMSTGVKTALSLFVLVVIIILFAKYVGGKKGSGSSM